MLSWKVLNWDSNKNEVVNYDIFGKHYEDKLKKARKNKKFTNRLELKEYLRRDFQYQYWSRSEYEIMVGPLSCKFNKLEKIDVFRQLEMNLDRITDYVISEMNFRFKNDKKMVREAGN